MGKNKGVPCFLHSATEILGRDSRAEQGKGGIFMAYTLGLLLESPAQFEGQLTASTNSVNDVVSSLECV